MEIIDRANNILTYLDKAKDIKEKYASDVKLITYDIIQKETDKILETIPLEELTNRKAGIHIKYLYDAGYKNIADLKKANIFKIGQIEGIGVDTSYVIRKLLNDISYDVSKQAKLRISVDNQSDDYYSLLSKLIKYQKLDMIVDDIADVDMLSIKNAIDKKDGNKLSLLLNGIEGKKIRDIFNKLDKAIKDDSNPFEFFKDNSIVLINCLEEIVPDVTLNMDDNFGLPKEIVEEVKQQEIKEAGLKCQLRNYQKWGVKYILNQKKVLLGDEMGLGKTIQAIATMVSLNNIGENKFLVVCPASVIINWCKEISEKSTLSVIKIYGEHKQEMLEKWKKYGGVGVTTFETTSMFSIDAKYSMLIVDEAHYVKNYETRRSISVRALCEHTDRILFMSGTPLENNVKEMIGLINILRPDIAKKLKGKEYLSQASSFKEIITPVYYRRKREDVLKELPEMIEKNQWCSLLSEEKRVYYKAVLSENYSMCRRVSFNMEDLTKSSKALRLKEIVEEAKLDNRKVIVFSFYLNTIEKVCELFKDICIGPINGSLSPKKRQELIDEFTKDDSKYVLAAQIQSGGTGLNIQAASVVVLCEPQFKPSIENQAISRAYRMGQTRSVLVHRLLCEKTVDERVTKMLADKQKTFDYFADEALASKEEMEIDDTTFSKIMNEEVTRVSKEIVNES